MCIRALLSVSALLAHILIDISTSTRNTRRWCSRLPCQSYADHHYSQARTAFRCLSTPRSRAAMSASPTRAKWFARTRDTCMWWCEGSTRREECFGRECAHATEWDGVDGARMWFVAPRRCGHRHPKSQRWVHACMDGFAEERGIDWGGANG